MKAVMWRKYGDTKKALSVESDIAIPEITKDNQVLVKIEYASLHPGDDHIMRPLMFPIRFMFGLFSPKNRVFGMNGSGIVHKVGDSVTEYKVGDKVFTDSIGLGALSEYQLVTDKRCCKIPSHMSTKEAAALGTSSSTAQYIVDLLDIKENQTVLVTGASGGVGSSLVMLFNQAGVIVTGVASGKHEESIRKLGANEFIDYKKTDWANDDNKYDYIVDCYNTLNSKGIKTMVAKKESIYYHIGGNAFMSAVWASITDKKVNLLTYDTNHETMKNLVKNLEKDELKVPIAKGFDSLEKVFDAMDFLMNSNKSVLGKLVIKVQQ